MERRGEEKEVSRRRRVDRKEEEKEGREKQKSGKEGGHGRAIPICVQPGEGEECAGIQWEGIGDAAHRQTANIRRHVSTDTQCNRRVFARGCLP